jgi:hypothetical protein
MTLGLVPVLAFLALNVVAFNQAWSMTHFTTDGSRTSAPENLALLEKARVALVGVRLPKPVNNIEPSFYRLPLKQFASAVRPERNWKAGSFRAHERKGSCFSLTATARARRAC